jgi:ribosomal protein S12 methylthiotransferase
MYLYPVGISEQLMETVAGSKKILRYFDIPIQHINNAILKSMRRPDTKEKIIALIEKLRAVMPDVVMRTTVIVGLPGETEENFQELIEFIEWAKFDALGCFKYWRESGTAAAEMDNQVEEDVKRQRVEDLMLTQQRIAFVRNRSRIGERLRCIVESVDGKGGGRGRFYGQAPEIDSVCLIKKCRGKMGEFIETRVVGTQDYDLIVEQI